MKINAIFFFELLPKLSDYVNSDNSIGKISSKSIACRAIEVLLSKTIVYDGHRKMQKIPLVSE